MAVCARLCVCTWVHVCVHGCVRTWVCVCTCVCALVRAQAHESLTSSSRRPTPLHGGGAGGCEDQSAPHPHPLNCNHRPAPIPSRAHHAQSRPRGPLSHCPCPPQHDQRCHGDAAGSLLWVLFSASDYAPQGGAHILGAQAVHSRCRGSHRLRRPLASATPRWTRHPPPCPGLVSISLQFGFLYPR